MKQIGGIILFDINLLPKTFLGANAAGGFCSHFSDCYDPDDGWTAYIIKGGPGTGKSSLMKQVAALFAETGERVELCPCSSDPDSLDGVILHSRKTVLLDGTSPHVVEPRFPGVCERIINLGDCWDAAAFRGCESEVLRLTRLNKKLHAEASRYITAAGTLLDERYQKGRDACNEGRVLEYAERLVGRVVSRENGGKEHLRFLGGITPKGAVFLKNTITKLCDTVLCVCDEWGAVSDLFMKTVRASVAERGCEAFICFDSICPDRIAHILIPSQRLAFCTEGMLSHPDGITRRIHARRFYAPCLSSRQYAFELEAAEQLLREAVRLVSEAKKTHDLLEEHYINAMDFAAVGERCRKVVEEIKAIPII